MKSLSSACQGSRSAFSLPELLLVIATVSVLASLLMPAARTLRQAAWSTACSGNLRSIGMGATYYSSDWQGSYLKLDPWVAYGNWEGSNTGHFANQGIWSVALLRGGYLGDDPKPVNYWDPENRENRLLNCPAQRLPVWIFSLPNGTANGPTYRVSICFSNWADNGCNHYRMVAQVRRPTATPYVLEADGSVNWPSWFGIWPGERIDWGGYGMAPIGYIHRSATNVLFFDGHVSSLRPEGLVPPGEYWWGMPTPARDATWNPFL